MPDISKRLEKAEKYVQKGKLDDALTEYLQAFKEDPSNDNLVEIIAELYLKRSQPEKALECYGYLFDKRAEVKDGPGALLMYRKMARVGVQDPARMLQCATFLEKNKPAEAREYYRMASQLFLDRDQKKQALEALTGLASLDSKNADVFYNLGDLAERMGATEKAAQAFARAGELVRSNGAAADNHQALEMLERAHKLQPKDARVAELFGAALLESGKAARTVEILKPFAAQTQAERNCLFARACLATGELSAAEEALWPVAQNSPEAQQLLWKLAETYLGAVNSESAVNVLRRLKQVMSIAHKEEEFLTALEGLQQKKVAGIEITDFLISVYSEMSRMSKARDVLVSLFESGIAASAYPDAGKALGRLADVAPDDPTLQKRLDALDGKLDEAEFKTLSARVMHTPMPLAGDAAGEVAGSLDEMILQAEMLMQFGSRESAAEYLKGLAKHFPGEETRNARLHSLLVEAGLPVAGPSPAAVPAQSAPAAAPAKAAPAAMTAVAEEPLADLSRVTEITRVMNRQATIKGVLTTSVNEIGKAWRVSRCLVALCTPGRKPTAALEYCATGVRQSDAASIVSLVPALVQATAGGDVLAADDALTHPHLADVAGILRSLGAISALVLPLVDADAAESAASGIIGVIFMQQCDKPRRWHPSEILVAKTVADQMVVAMANVKLRSLMKAVADERSGLLNRSSYIDCLLSETARAMDQKIGLSAALLRFGEQMPSVREPGASVQKYTQDAAQALLAQLRENDIGVRYDPSTLALILPDTRAADLPNVIERVRKMIAGVIATGGVTPPMTAAAGEAKLNGSDAIDCVTELINRLEVELEATLRERQPAKVS